MKLHYLRSLSALSGDPCRAAISTLPGLRQWLSAFTVGPTSNGYAAR